MFRCGKRVVLSSVGLWILASPAFLQLRAQAPATSPPTQPTTVIRSTTRLVQISVAATDNKGRPILGLTKDDFTILDEGAAQQIAFFTAPIAAPKTPVPPLPPNTFTNRTELIGEDPSAVTVILLDGLNTVGQDQSYVRKQVLKYLETMKPQDHVAIYGLTMDLRLLQDFTQDATALTKAVENFKPKELILHDASHSDQDNVVNFGNDQRDWGHLSQAISNGDAATANLALNARIQLTTAAFQYLAGRMNTLPGRKSLIWISGGFPVDLTGEDPTSDRDPRNWTMMNRIIESLNGSNTVVYAIDTHGVSINPGVGPESRSAAPLTASLRDPMFRRENTRDTLRGLAARTGGRAFYGTNRVQDAMTTAFNDGRFAYTIGYYPSHGQWDGKYRKIEVALRQKQGQLRYRRGYYAELEPPKSDQDTMREALHSAALSPVDATGLGLLVTARATESNAVAQSTVLNPGERTVDLRIQVAPTQLLLKESPQHNRTGSLELFYLQRAATGEIVAMEGQQIDVNLDPQKYAALANAGMIFERHLKVADQTTELRTIVWDKNSHATGSVTVPLKSIFPAAAIAPSK
jgi:VWFA-related protein